MREAHSLARAENLFELPLDSIKAKELKKAVELRGGRLSPWPGVRGVDEDLSKEYQQAALGAAEDDY